MTLRRRPWILALLLAIPLLSPVSLAAEQETEWTVVTLARDGSWGVGTAEYYGPALASALRKCDAMSDGQSDCGAEVTAVRQGWTLGILCGDHRVLVAATDLTIAIMEAQARQIYLRGHYGESLPSCSCVIRVDPQGFAEASGKPARAARTGLGK
jgi:hypothetical protein